MRVAVAGAGPAGLAAAWELAERGVTVDLLERAATPGGMLRTELLDGALVDVGVQLVASPHTSFMELVRRAGAGAQLQRSAGHDALWRRGRAHGITYGSVSSMIASGALPMTLKMKLGAKYLPYLNTQARGLDANDLTTADAKFYRESIGEWGRRELGEDFVELLVYPLLAAYYGATPEETAAGVYHALARVGMDVSVYGAAGGFGAVATALVAALEERGCTFRGGCAVSAVRPHGDAVALDGVAYDGVVLAVPANVAAALLHAAGEDPLATWLRQVEERDTLTVALRLDRPFPGDYFGLSFPRAGADGARIAAVCIQRHKLGGLVPPGGDALVVMPAPAALPALTGRPDDDVIAALLSDLAETVPGLDRRVTGAHVYRFSDAYTLFSPAHLERLRTFNASWLPPRVTLAGDYMRAPSVEGAVRSGRDAASLLLAQLR